MKPHLPAHSSGCCPGHDDYPTRRWSGTYRGRRAKHNARARYLAGVRAKRRTERQALRMECDR